jgi:hypothetical protein
MWVHPLWPYSRDQDGVFVHLQALIPAKEPAKQGSGKAGKGGSGKGKDAAGRSADQGKASSAAPRQLNRLWFVRLGEPLEGGGFKARLPQELPQELALLPSLIH